MALSAAVDLAQALHPTNDSERLLFRQFAPTLVRVDCVGNLHPALAESWQRGPEPGEWMFTLRDGGGLEGTPLTAHDVVAAFTLPDARALGVDSAVYVNARQVRVRLRGGQDTLPRLFADPALALTRGLVSRGGPTGRLVFPGTDGRPTMDFQLAENSDPRDALDRGVDLAITRDPAVVEYVAGRSELETYPLPWSRTYILLQPSGAPVLSLASDSVRSSLARDAVRAEARPAEPPFWWDSLSVCSGHDVEQHLTASRIVYPTGDDVARGLAERIVALAGSEASFRAAGLAPAELTAALRDHTERAYVVAAPRASLAPCRDASAWPSGVSIQPLIDTRARAIVRRGFSGLTVDWDGTVRVLP